MTGAPALSPEAAEHLALIAESHEEWAAECFTIRDKADDLRPLRFRPMQRAIEAAEERQLATRGRARLLVLKGRQGGVTTHQQSKNLFTAWREEGVKCLTLAHTRDDTDKIFLITQTALEHFPAELLPAQGEKATREVSFPGLSSYFWTGTAGSKRVGRGLTLRRLHGSEFFLWDAPRKTLNALTPAIERPGTAVVLESTASAYGSVGHAFWNESEKGQTGYAPLFFPWWECDPDVYRTPLEAPDELVLSELEEDERQLVTVKGLDLEQIKWRRAMMGTMGKDDFLQEYAEDAQSCWLSAGGLVYEARDLKALNLMAPAPVWDDRNGALKWFVSREELDAMKRGGSLKAIIGADTAEGVDGDRSAAVGRTLEGRLLCTFEDRRIDPLAFAGVLDALGRELSGDDDPAFIVPEKNAHGITVIRKLRDTHDYSSARIYHRRTHDKTTEQRGDRIGWLTSAETKPLLVDAGRELITAALRPTGPHRFTPPAAAAVTDAFGVRRDPETGKVVLNGKDLWVSECLCWLGRSSYASVPSSGATRW